MVGTRYLIQPRCQEGSHLILSPNRLPKPTGNRTRKHHSETHPERYRKKHLTMPRKTWNGAQKIASPIARDVAGKDPDRMLTCKKEAACMMAEGHPPTTAQQAKIVILT